ncbi:MAG: hypothetical protein HZC48_11675 [Nitrospirae bacterium]|nr:hypothetical protein [Nitrospirota bacterium]
MTDALNSAGSCAREREMKTWLKEIHERIKISPNPSFSKRGKIRPHFSKGGRGGIFR